MQKMLTWPKFVTRFDNMFIPKTSMNAKEDGLLNLCQGDMTVDFYERKFKALCHFTVNLDVSTKV